MARYRIAVHKNSTRSDIRLFEVTAPTKPEAIKLAAAEIFGSPFLRSDFVYRKKWFSKQYTVTHRNLSVLSCVLEVEQVAL